MAVDFLTRVLTGSMQMDVIGKNGSETGTWDTEIVSLDLSGDIGGTPVLLRENPAISSDGHVTVLKLAVGGGGYSIDSFFDVFTELSVDGGSLWSGPTNATRFRLVPEPASMSLRIAGGIGWVVRRRRS